MLSPNPDGNRCTTHPLSDCFFFLWVLRLVAVFSPVSCVKVSLKMFLHSVAEASERDRESVSSSSGQKQTSQQEKRRAGSRSASPG